MNPLTLAQTLIDLIIEESSGLDDLGRRIVANRIVGVLAGCPRRRRTASRPA